MSRREQMMRSSFRTAGRQQVGRMTRKLPSCDNCRLSKSKCTRGFNGFCQRCLRSGQVCTTSGVKAPRPYYQTSKEQFHLMTELLRCFLPTVSVEVDDLRQTLDALAECQDQTNGPCSISATICGQPAIDTTRIRTGGHAEGPQDSSTAVQAPDCAPEAPPISRLGANPHVIVDILGEDFVGASSWTGFSPKVAMLMLDRQPDLFSDCTSIDIDLNPNSSSLPNAPDPSFPSQAEFDSAVSVYFAEINNVTYILDAERIETTVESVLLRRTNRSSTSLAIFHLIMALGATSSHHLREAVLLFHDILTESSLGSVQALMLLTLAYLRTDSRKLAWITLGCASRVAQSLGMHCEALHSRNIDQAKRQSMKRLWWSLCDIELTLGWFHFGRPLSIDHAQTTITLPSEAEIVLNVHTPPGYLFKSAELTQIITEAYRRVFQDPLGFSSPSQATVTELVQIILKWWDDQPSYLRPESPSAPSYARAINFLCLRYYHVLMAITRPFLLEQISQQSSNISQEVRYLAEICKMSNEKATKLLVTMASTKRLSKVHFLDSFYILANSMVIGMRAFQAREQPSIVAELEEYAKLLVWTHGFRAGRCISILFDKNLDYVKQSAGQMNSDFPSLVDAEWYEGLDFDMDINLAMIEQSEVQLIESPTSDPI